MAKMVLMAGIVVCFAVGTVAATEIGVMMPFSLSQGDR